jgi:hypothetical protein
MNSKLSAFRRLIDNLLVFCIKKLGIKTNFDLKLIDCDSIFTKVLLLNRFVLKIAFSVHSL